MNLSKQATTALHKIRAIRKLGMDDEARRRIEKYLTKNLTLKELTELALALEDNSEGGQRE